MVANGPPFRAKGWWQSCVGGSFAFFSQDSALLLREVSWHHRPNLSQSFELVHGRDLSDGFGWI